LRHLISVFARSGAVPALALALAPVVAAGPALAASPAVSTDPAHPPEVVAPIALLVDVNSGRVLFERQSHRRFVPASLTKIMTSYVAFELAAQGKLNLDTPFVMRPETFRQWHRVGSTMFLDNNSRTRAADLLEGIVTVSANDACIVLAEGIAGSVPGFTAMMNAKARALGMRDTHYNTPNGWMDEGRTYVSAADLATLSTALITRHPDLYARFYGRDAMTWNGIAQQNHNPLYGVVAGADGVKTGFTNEAGYGLVGSAQRGGRRLMVVVGGYDKPQDRARRGSPARMGLCRLRRKAADRRRSPYRRGAGARGTASSVGLVTPRAFAMLSPHGQTLRPSLAIRYKGPLHAPIAKGQDIATLVVRTPGQPEARLPLVAAENIGQGA
jgi:D-alanyl-D-alanine carboxypeptidase (penicillin-binding protein 5/6)